MLPPKKKPPSGAATLNQVRQLRLVSRNAASSFMRLDKPPPKEKNYAVCGAMAMATAAEYRQWAEECFKWARDASDEDVRESYTKMGQHWLECAERASSQQSSVASAMTRRKSD
jgi:hypothetical protein